MTAGLPVRTQTNCHRLLDEACGAATGPLLASLTVLSFETCGRRPPGGAVDRLVHILLTVRDRTSRRETRSSSHAACRQPASLCERAHALFDIALLYSCDRFDVGSAVSGISP